jgi:hypothetical protein
MVAPFLDAYTSPTTAKVWVVSNNDSGTLGGTPADWDAPGFDDSAWVEPRDVGEDGFSPGRTFDSYIGTPAAPSRYVAPAAAIFGSYGRDLVFLVRMRFFLPSLPTAADLFHNEDDASTIKINQVAPSSLGGSAIAVTPFVIGWNVLTATVTNLHEPSTWDAGNPTMFIARLFTDVEATSGEPPPDPGPIVIVSDPADVELATLTEVKDGKVRIELDGTGAGSFSINRYSAEATAAVLKPGNIVRVKVPQIDPNAIFGFFLEAGDFKLVSSDEEGGEIITFSGRGGLAYWDRAIWLNESFLVDWVPAFIRTEHGAPPAGTLGAVRYAAGSYQRFTIGGGAITSRIDFTTGTGFTSYYDSRIRVVYDSDGHKTTVIHLTTGGVAGWWVKPYGAGVTDYPKKSAYTFGPSVLMSNLSAASQPGEVIYEMYGEATAADRPIKPIPLMTIDFSATLDSDGNPWTVTDATAGISSELGDDYLSTIGKLVNTGAVDVVMGPDLDMHAYNSYGRDLTGSSFGTGVVRFAKAVNIADELDRQNSDSPVGTFAEVLGNADGVIARVELADAATRTPREISVRGDTDDTDALAALGLSELEARLLHSDAIGFAVATPIIGKEDPDHGLYLPGPPGSAHGNYWIGDLVTLHTGTGEHDFNEDEVRVAAITLTFSEANDLRVVVEVNSGFGGFQDNGGSQGSSTSTTGGVASTISDQYQLLSERDQPNGYPSLDGDGLVDPAELPFVETLLTAATDATLVLGPDGAGGLEFRAESGGGGLAHNELDSSEIYTVPDRRQSLWSASIVMGVGSGISLGSGSAFIEVT